MVPPRLRASQGDARQTCQVVLSRLQEEAQSRTEHQRHRDGQVRLEVRQNRGSQCCGAVLSRRAAASWRRIVLSWSWWLCFCFLFPLRPPLVPLFFLTPPKFDTNMCFVRVNRTGNHDYTTMTYNNAILLFASLSVAIPRLGKSKTPPHSAQLPKLTRFRATRSSVETAELCLLVYHDTLMHVRHVMTTTRANSLYSKVVWKTSKNIEYTCTFLPLQDLIASL